MLIKTRVLLNIFEEELEDNVSFKEKFNSLFADLEKVNKSQGELSREIIKELKNINIPD